MIPLSRRSLARGFLTLLQAKGRPHALAALAAAISVERRARDIEFITQEIGRELLRQKQEVHATVTSAHELSAPLKKTILALIQKKSGALAVLADYAVDPALHGGVVITTPNRTINASISQQIATLKHLA